MKISPLRRADAAPIAKITGSFSGKRLIWRKSARTPPTTRTNSQQFEGKPIRAFRPAQKPSLASMFFVTKNALPLNL
ncbi:MAG: hypothetical protein WAN31_05645 [Methylovirgula sp.]